MKIIPTLIVGVLAASSAFAQTPARVDTPWTPWLGCWQLVQDDVRPVNAFTLLDSLRSTTQRQSSRSRQGADDIVACVMPATANVNEVQMTTFVGGRSVLEQTIVSDGMSRPIVESGCRGAQTSEWSSDGQRLFTRAELDCTGQPKRTVSGITLLARGPSWLDIQAIDLNGDQQVRVRRYARTSNEPAAAAELPQDLLARARMASQLMSVAPLTIDDVVEASSKIASQAVEAALVESGSQFDLDSRTLIRLADARVQANVIDVMVALSYPDHFRVERNAQTAAPITTYSSSTTTDFFGAQYGGYYSPYGAYDPYAYYYYYSPFAYSYWGSPYYIIPGASSVLVVPSPSGSGTQVQPRGDHGRMVNGRGYTQITPTSPDSGSSDSTSSTNGGTRTTGRSGDASSGSSGSSSSGGSSGGMSPGGYSGGGSGGGGGSDSGRTAQPR